MSVDFTANLEAHRRRCAEHEIAWRAWAKDNAAPTSRCIRHAIDCPLNEAGSIRQSFVAGKMMATYNQCPACKLDATVRAQSRHLREAGVADENVLHATFDNFVCRTDGDRENLDTAREFSSRLRGFLVLLGKPGLGKTHMAVAIMRVAGTTLRFTTQKRMLSGLRARYNDKYAPDVVEMSSRVGLFVLDEIGLSEGGRDELPMLHEVLSYRHERRKPTVLTSNLREAEFNEAIGERMADRLRQSGVAKLIFAGESMRPQFRKEYHE